MNLYLISHNGLGDNLFMVGAINFLLKFYNKIHFICKKKYVNNVILFFINNLNIILIPFDKVNTYIDEVNSIKNIISDKYDNVNNDIFICGRHKDHMKSKITNIKFLNYTIIDKKYTIDYDTLTSENYKFIEKFYTDINLNLTYFYEYFDIPDTKFSIYLYNSIKSYYIIFIQLKSSDNKELNISNILNKYLYDSNTILICNDNNLYNINDNKIKYNICQQFVYNKIVYYKDTILNSDEIYIIDSCFIGIILLYLKTNRLKTNKVRIILRSSVNNIIL
jgi:hypothetical protein